MNPEEAAKERRAARKKPAVVVEPIECPICMEDSEKWVGLACSHKMCFGCAKSWQRTGKDTCPFCREPSKILCWLKSTCPRRSTDGVSIVAARKARRRNATRYFSCHGCGGCVLYEYGTRHSTCKTRTCNRCYSIAQDLGTVKCATCLSEALFGAPLGQRPAIIEGGIFGPGAAIATMLAVNAFPPPTFAQFAEGGPPPAFVDLTSTQTLDLTQDEEDLGGPSSLSEGIESPTRSTSASLIPT